MQFTNENIEPFNHAEIENRLKDSVKSEENFYTTGAGFYEKKLLGDASYSESMFFDYGFDCILLYVMFMYPQKADLKWGDRNTDAIYHFLSKIWRISRCIDLNGRLQFTDERKQIFESFLDDIRFYKEKEKYHNVVAIYMKMANSYAKDIKHLSKEEWTKYLQNLHTYAPFITKDIIDTYNL